MSSPQNPSRSVNGESRLQREERQKEERRIENLHLAQKARKSKQNAPQMTRGTAPNTIQEESHVQRDTEPLHSPLPQESEPPPDQVPKFLNPMDILSAIAVRLLLGGVEVLTGLVVSYIITNGISSIFSALRNFSNCTVRAHNDGLHRGSTVPQSSKDSLDEWDDRDSESDVD